MRTRLHPIAAAAIAWLTPLLAGAQVRTDGSLGGTARDLAGPTYAITENLGRRAGNNLFHSFETFRVGSGETALFSTTTPTIANVFSRVTGGGVSTINGTLQLQAAAGAPALFLVNPAGVVFGPGAAIDVPGAFHVSTADSVRFPDGVFHAEPARASTFSSAPPEAFGFLGERRGAVVLQGAQLSTGNAPLSIVAGDVTLTDGALVRNQGGEERVAAVGGQAAEIPLQGGIANPLQGAVRLEAGSLIMTIAPPGGTGGRIHVAAGQLDIDGGEAYAFTGVRSETESGGRAGDLSVRVAGSTQLDHNGVIGSYSEGIAGDVALAAGSLFLGYGGIYSSGDERGGNVDVRIAGNARIDDSIRSSGGEGGAVRVRAEHLAVEEWGSIYNTSKGGKAGPVEVAAKNLDLAGSIDSGRGGGELNVKVEETLRLDEGTGYFGLISTEGAPARVQARRIVMNNGLMYRSPGTNMDGGAFSVVATDALEMHSSGISASGGGGVHAPLTVTAGRLLMDDSYIAAAVAGTEQSAMLGGDIVVSVAGEAQLINNSAIATELLRNASAADRASNIVVRAGALVVRDSVIESVNESMRGSGGDITLQVDGPLRVHRQAAVVADESDSAFVGVQATQSSFVGPFVTATSGAVTIRVGQLRVEGTPQTRDFTGILTSGTGIAAGNIDVEVRDTADLHLATLKSQGQYSSDSGSILLTAGTAVQLQDSTIDTVTTGGSPQWGYGYAGDIELRAPAVHLLGSAQESVRISSGGTSARYTGDDGITRDSEGGAGSIRLIASGPVTLRGNTFISADGYAIDGTYGAADTAPGLGRTAGRIEIEGASLLLDGMGEGRHVAISSITAGSGTGQWARGGDIALRSAGPIDLRHGVVISASTFGRGDAGAISVAADSLRMQHAGDDQTGISSQAGDTARGNAGRITVRLTGDLELRDGARIDASAGLGAGGGIEVEAANVTVTGTGVQSRPVGGTWQDIRVPSAISATDIPGSPGQMGDISISATGRILVEDGGRITMSTQAEPLAASAPRLGILRLTAPRVEVRGAIVDAFSIGSIPASDIQIDASSLVALDDGYITTSATGSAGAGGNIRITAPVLALNTGFVQANATAVGASGGNITLDVRALLPSHESLQVGGDTVEVFEAGRIGGNVIQAVAPTGVSGNIQIASPALDITGALKGVAAEALPNAPLGKSPCQRTGGSSLALAGRGGLPPSPSEPAGMWTARAGDAMAEAAVARTSGSAGCTGS